MNYATLLPLVALVAQSDRAPVYETGGRKFESCRARHLVQQVTTIPLLEAPQADFGQVRNQLDTTNASATGSGGIRILTFSPGRVPVYEKSLAI